jgi:hypothetical protein
VANASQDAQLVTGRYIVSRRAETTIMSVMSAFGQLKVVANSDGTVSADGLKDLNGENKKFKEIAPLMFRDVNGQARIAFKRDDSGRLLMAIDYPFMVFQKSPWYLNSALQTTLIIGAVIILALTLLLWPVAALIRWHYGQKLTLTPAQRRLRLLVRIVCVVDLAFLLGFVLFFTVAMKDIGLLSPRYNGWLRFIQIVGWLGVLGTVFALYNLVRSWTSAGRWIWAKLGDTVVALACVAFVWFVFTWNMLHWSLRY